MLYLSFCRCLQPCQLICWFIPSYWQFFKVIWSTLQIPYGASFHVMLEWWAQIRTVYLRIWAYLKPLWQYNRLHARGTVPASIFMIWSYSMLSFVLSSNIAYACWTAPSNQMHVCGFCRTAVNAQSGVRTPAAGIITGKRPSPLTLPAYGSSCISITHIHGSFLLLGAWDLGMWPLDLSMRCWHETDYEMCVWDLDIRAGYEVWDLDMRCG